VSDGKTAAQASKEAGIVEKTYFRCRKEYGGLQVDQARRQKRRLAIRKAPLLGFVAGSPASGAPADCWFAGCASVPRQIVVTQRLWNSPMGRTE
jgi:hypothetical protein